MINTTVLDIVRRDYHTKVEKDRKLQCAHEWRIDYSDDTKVCPRCGAREELSW